MIKMEKILGIDFGTSTTVFSMTSLSGRFEPEIVEIDGKSFVETVMRLDDDGEIELFGTEAWEQADQSPERTFFEFKMGIGTDGACNGTNATHSPRDLGVIFLRRCREKIERQHFNRASLADQNMLCVVGYPAEWTEKQRTETIFMVQDAGFPNVTGCEEPVGVVYFHHFKGDLSVDTNQIMLVYDFGGGTSDVAVVQTKAGEKPTILGIGGAVNLGGRDFDQAIFEFLVQKYGWNTAVLTPRDSVVMRRAARNLKEKLGTAVLDGHQCVESVVNLYSIRSHKRLCLEANTFEASCGQLVQRFPEPVWEAMNRADVSPEAVKISILAGGAARMHYVHKALDELFPNDTILQSLNPAEVVAKGLAIYGRAIQDEIINTSVQRNTTGQIEPTSAPFTESSPNSQHPSRVSGGHTLPNTYKFWQKIPNRQKWLLICSALGLILLSFSLLWINKKGLNTPQSAHNEQIISVKFEYLDGILDDDFTIINNNNFSWNNAQIVIQGKSGASEENRGPVYKKFKLVEPKQKVFFENIWTSAESVRGHVIRIYIKTNEGTYDKTFQNNIISYYKKEYNWIQIDHY